MMPWPVTASPAEIASRRRGRGDCNLHSLVAIAAAVSAIAVGLGAPPAVAAPGVAWQIAREALPTVLPPATSGAAGIAGPHLELSVTNVGGAEASSGVTITARVSHGAAPVRETAGYQNPAAFRPDNFPQEPFERTPCVIAGQTVTCEVKVGIPPGESLHVAIPLELEAAPPETITSELSVSSPGVTPQSDTLSARTGAEAAPFEFVATPAGLSGSAFDEAGGTPAAGAHPFVAEMSVHEPVVERGHLVSADPLRRLSLELPAGLIANPLAVTERCTLVEIQEAVAPTPVQACPAASQVGIVHFSIPGNLEGTTSPLSTWFRPPVCRRNSRL